ncbi:MAG: DNA topoisomerase 3 [Armatimonadetes bacterium]|nr:DNA topoisomerase 3 [Armatimonadota bacterium]
MSKALVVAEKPSVARDIAAALGGFKDHEGFLESSHYVVSWAVGHLLEFKEPEEIDPKYRRWVLEDLPILPAPFALKPKPGQSERLRVLKKLYNRSDVDELVNACDAGREGELIFREIADYLNGGKAARPRPVRRLWLQSMTRDAIREGFNQLLAGQDFDNLGAAAQCRSEADWLIGINATRALTRRMKTRSETTAWSAGRVQTPTLALLVDRELENLTHRPEPFWRIKATFQAADHTYLGTWYDPKFQPDPDLPRKDDWILDKDQLDRILEEVRGKQADARETRKPQKESAPPLFDLTSLQREANRRFGYSARRTLQAAQRLYETHKVLTYPRTDSKCLPQDYRSHVQQVLGELRAEPGYGSFASFLSANGLRNQSRVFDDSKVSDHFAIIPTTGAVPDLSGDDQRVYDLVMRRFLAAFYPPAVWTRVERDTAVAGHRFRTRARFLTEPGWYEVWGREEEDASLPPLVGLDAAGEKLTEGLMGRPVSGREDRAARVRTLDAQPEADETRPPARYSEGRLLSLMEHAGRHVDDEELTEVLKGKGLGTPATRAEIIENLISKQYVRRGEKSLRATPKGILLIDLLRRIQIERLASPALTGELEKHLADVEAGTRSRDAFMQEIEDYACEIVERAKTFQYDELYAGDPPLGECSVQGLGGLPVVERARFYTVENPPADAPKLLIWKEKGGRYIDLVTMTELLQRGETGELEGFLTSRGQGYTARLRLSPTGELELLSEGGAARGLTSDAEIPEDAEPIAVCPFHPEGRIYETPTAYRCKCEGRCLPQHPQNKSGAILPKQVCHREMTVEDAIAFFRERTTPEFNDFISRFGRPFAARLILKDNGKHGFEFSQKKAGRKKAAAGAKAGQAASKKKGKKKAPAAKKAAAAPKGAPAEGAPRKAAAADKAGPRKAAAAKKTAPRKSAAKKKTTRKKTGSQKP